MTRRRWLVVALAVTGCAVVAIKRDRDQQRRLDDLSARVAALSEAAQALALPLQALPALIAGRRCAIDPQDLERLARRPPDTSPDTSAETKGKGSPRIAAIAAVAPEQEKPGRAELSPEQTAALDRAKARLQDAIARHALTRDDVLEMRTQLATVGSRQEAEALRARIATAINHRELVPQDRLFILP